MRLGWIHPPSSSAEATAGRLAQTHRPRSSPYLMQDMLHCKEAGADVMVSCLTFDDERRWGLLDEQRLAEASGLQFRRCAITDHQIPGDHEVFDQWARTAAEDVIAGRGVVIHCFAGIGRSGMLTVAALVHAGLALGDALALARDARGLMVPETEAQLTFLQKHYADR